MTQARGNFSSQRVGGRGGGPKVGAARGTSRLQGQSYEILRDSTAARPLFFASARGGSPCSAAFVPAAPPEVEKLRVFRLRPPVFSSFARAFFVRRPGRPAPRGEVCRPSRARIAHPSQPLFVFSLHRFTQPVQHADNLHIVGEGFAFSPSPRSSLPHGGRRCERQAQRARREIGQFLLMRR